MRRSKARQTRTPLRWRWEWTARPPAVRRRLRQRRTQVRRVRLSERVSDNRGSSLPPPFVLAPPRAERDPRHRRRDDTTGHDPLGVLIEKPLAHFQQPTDAAVDDLVDDRSTFTPRLKAATEPQARQV